MFFRGKLQRLETVMVTFDDVRAGIKALEEKYASVLALENEKTAHSEDDIPVTRIVVCAKASLDMLQFLDRYADKPGLWNKLLTDKSGFASEKEIKQKVQETLDALQEALQDPTYAHINALEKKLDDWAAHLNPNVIIVEASGSTEIKIPRQRSLVIKSSGEVSEGSIFKPIGKSLGELAGEGIGFLLRGIWTGLKGIARLAWQGAKAASDWLREQPRNDLDESWVRHAFEYEAKHGAATSDLAAVAKHLVQSHDTLFADKKVVSHKDDDGDLEMAKINSGPTK